MLTARLVGVPLVTRVMRLAIRLVVPRHRVGVEVVVMDDFGRVLALHHVFHPAAPWGLPGGWLARGESPQACAARELREETGLEATIGPAVHFGRADRSDHLNSAFLAFATAQPLQLSGEIIAGEWFEQDALPPMLPFTRRAIEAALLWQENNDKQVGARG